MSTDLLKCAKDLFIHKEPLEEIKRFLLDMQGLDGNGNIDQWEQLKETAAVWKDQYLIRSDTVSIYGYLTWYLNIWAGEFRFPVNHDLKDSLIKMLLINALSDIDDDKRFTSEVSVTQRLELERDEWTERHSSCTLLSHDELIEDLERFYTGSHKRLENHIQKYKEHTGLNRMLVEADKKYLKYIACAKSCSEIEQIVRINRLGVCENENTCCTENALYFMLNDQSLYLLTFCDFA